MTSLLPALQVRRQIYIIRTSGARLLALINDVMDAAALRHSTLVLKQEPVRSCHRSQQPTMPHTMPDFTHMCHR